MKELKNQEALTCRIAHEDVVLVQFGSHTCSPCSAIRRRIDLWQRDYPGVCCLYVPVEAFPELCGQLGVFVVPTVFVYVQKKLTLRESGYFSLDQLLRQTEKYCRILGMDSAQ